ncbi:hypothetical protein HEK616_68190 [Streptomyces nigrescens]|uniref:Uncharacterized protein n=2 Tax=Streptomyces nigrescens TaxID=1920 RepID=A0ABN6R6L7_STRNI|nr:hypothetical protein HEK616_68190 [Streptomyces nigrescens]
MWGAGQLPGSTSINDPTPHQTAHGPGVHPGAIFRAVPLVKGVDSMKYIVPVQAVVTATEYDGGPTAAELDAIDVEMPLISAEVELLDVQIMVLDRVPSELDERRIRRARRKVLAARRELANLPATTASVPEVGA